jgi:hypothetical protein
VRETAHVLDRRQVRAGDERLEARVIRERQCERQLSQSDFA